MYNLKIYYEYDYKLYSINNVLHFDQVCYFVQKSTRRAIHVQLRKEARQRYSNSTPPLRPRATMDPDHFTRFDSNSMLRIF